MAKVQMCNVEVGNNPAKFTDSFQFDIYFECIEDLQEDLEWKVVYVGSSESEDQDQVLDCICVGPITAGRHKFTFTADPPDPSKIPESELRGVTVIFISCSFREQEFERVGYFLNNDYPDAETRESPPERTEVAALHRHILASDPRVTRFDINWGDVVPSALPGDPAVDAESCSMDHSDPALPYQSAKPGAFALSTDSVDFMQ